jgi:hypothetical protein
MSFRKYDAIQSLAIVMMIAVALPTVNEVGAQGEELYEKPPISYSTTAARDVVVQLQARGAAGELKWTGGGKAILERLLQELHIPVASQMLVFSKTSFQRQSISPGHPRAIYFSDTCYVGWVPGGLLEITTIDPQLGPIFYSFDPNTAEPRFVRDNNCLTCHGGIFVRGIPGVFARSVFTDDAGEPLFRFGSEVVDFRTPFTNRWAGWYVTGKHGQTLHRGNVFAQDQNGKLKVDFKRGANRTDLSDVIQTKAYPAPGSDIVALLVFEHQTAMQNTLTRAALDCRRMLAYQKNLQIELKEPVTEELTYDSVKSVFAGAAQDIVDDLLFKEEAPLPPGLEGDGAFQKAFRQETPRSRDGASLKDFHLAGHLFQNRCSYLIYSECFLKLPDELKRQVYARLGRALHPTEPDPEYYYLAAAERGRIAKILTETHPEFRSAAGR